LAGARISESAVHSDTCTARRPNSKPSVVAPLWYLSSTALRMGRKLPDAEQQEQKPSLPDTPSSDNPGMGQGSGPVQDTSMQPPPTARPPILSSYRPRKSVLSRAILSASPLAPAGRAIPPRHSTHVSWTSGLPRAMVSRRLGCKPAIYVVAHAGSFSSPRAGSAESSPASACSTSTSPSATPYATRRPRLAATPPTQPASA